MRSGVGFDVHLHLAKLVFKSKFQKTQKICRIQ